MTFKYLRNLKHTLEKYGVILSLNNYKIDIRVNAFRNNNLLKIRPLIYYILNTYDRLCIINIEGIPYCLLPSAEDHIIYNSLPHKRYVKRKECRDCKFTLTCPGLPNTNFFKKLNIKPVKDIPKQVAIEITKKCNLNCIICSQKDRKPISSPLSRIKNIIDEAYLLGIREIRFTGGEPLLENTKLISSIKYAKHKGFYILLNTNAVLLNKNIITEIENYIDNILISLHGFNSHTNSYITRRNDFRKKIEAVLMLQKSKIPILRIGTVITKNLLNNLHKYYILLKKLNIKIWELYRPMVPQKLLSVYRTLNISSQEMYTLIRFIYYVRRKNITAWIGNPLPFCSIKNKESLQKISLGARYDDGHSRIVWDAKGYFKPSYFININLGNSIQQAWNHPFIRKINSLEYLSPFCQDCKLLRWCLGGSRYWAYQYTGDFFGQDPWMKK